jgi:ABC-type lipoprotein export system ATPase subunit
VLVTHDPELAAEADLAIALKDGRVARITEGRQAARAAAAAAGAE